MHDEHKRISLTDRMVLIALGLGAVYWFIETFVYLVLSYEFDISSHLFGPNLNGLATRIIVLCLFLIFGSHAQYTFNLRKRAEAEVEKLKAANAELQAEVRALKEDAS